MDVDVEHNTTPVFSFVCTRILYGSVRISLSVCRKSFSLLQLVVQVFGVYTVVRMEEKVDRKVGGS